MSPSNPPDRRPDREAAPPAGVPTVPPSDGDLVRGWLIRIYQNHRTAFLVLANLLLIVVAFSVYHLLQPAPQRLTQRDIDAAVSRSIEKAPPKPSVASVAYDIIRPSLVFIQAKTGGPGNVAVGTGVVIEDTGIILTCLHVVQDAPEVKIVFANGMETEALVMVRQPEKDLAVLSAMQIPDDLVPATLASSATLRIGDEVIAAGNPFGIPFSASAGIVSGLGREYQAPDTGLTLRGLIQFDAAVNPGNSGGPLVNRDGEVVGIVAALLNPTHQDVFIGIGFAVPIDEAGGAIGFPPI
jgi:S1-C subfamily serine protease